MQRRILSFITIGFLFVSFINSGCNKLDTTDIGSDLLPAVDNVHTFADTLAITTTQGVFSPDTTVMTRTQDQAVGVTNDPLFGQTTAGMYFQLKPAFFPYFLGNAYDTLFNYGTGFDSVVLCLKYKGFYGDSTVPIQLDVKQVADNDFRDSVNRPNNVNYKPNVGQTIGTATIDIRRLADTVLYANNKDYSVNVIRIKLDPLWAATLFSQDSFAFHTGRNAFTNDSIYRRLYNGLALVPRVGGSGNALLYANLADPATRLEIHYRRRNGGLPVDTTFSSLVLNSDYYGTPTFGSSNTADNIVRNRPPLPSGDQEIYLQTNPGTYANLKIPGLSGLTNRIIHRAELVIQEIPDLSGYQDIFKGPSFLYLDLKDSGTVAKWKPIYYDLNPSVLYDPDYKNPLSVNFYPLQSGIDYLYFGGDKRTKTDQFGNTINFYNFNITKYVQDIVTNHRSVSDFRLFSPSTFSYPQYSPNQIPFNNSIAYGRVKVGGGNNPNYKMILRIIYSNL